MSQIGHRHHGHAGHRQRREGPTMSMQHIARALPGYQEVMERYSVNNINQWEAIKQTLYDSVAYAAAGSTKLTFFALPIGQGTGFGGGTKNESDTNMYMASNIPAMQAFLVQAVELIFQPTTPGNAGSAAGVVAQLPAATGATAAPLIANDVFYFRRAGNLQIQIGAKNYLTEAPLSKFPSKTNYTVEGALSDAGTTAGLATAGQATRLAYAAIKGPVYRLSPADLLLEANQNFQVTLNWPEGAQAITNPARVFCVLDGILYRASQ